MVSVKAKKKIQQDVLVFQEPLAGYEELSDLKIDIKVLSSEEAHLLINKPSFANKEEERRLKKDFDLTREDGVSSVEYIKFSHQYNVDVIVKCLDKIYLDIDYPDGTIVDVSTISDIEKVIEYIRDANDKLLGVIARRCLDIQFPSADQKKISVS